jgi:hypothetical protein
MTHETSDPPRKRERPAEGTTIVRLAIEWRRLQRSVEGTTDIQNVVACREAYDRLIDAIETRL